MLQPIDNLARFLADPLWGPALTNAVKIIVAVFAAFLIPLLSAASHYVRSQSRRGQLSVVGDAFRQVVEMMSEQSDVRRKAGAILLRRFFLPQAEFEVRQGVLRRLFRRRANGDDLPYWDEARNVIAAILRDEPAGVVQKVLADGLRFAPHLRHADLQGTNLTEAYLGEVEGRSVDITRADFYEATLIGASLTGCSGQRAVFGRAVMTGAKLREADLQGADFREAIMTKVDLRGADCRGARFEGATLNEVYFDDGTKLGGATFAGCIGSDELMSAATQAGSGA